jgi:hypothetical protein
MVPSHSQSASDTQRCVGCGRPLQLADLTRLWPVGASPRAAPPAGSAVAEATCRNCGYINYLSVPAANARPFGLPRDLVESILSCAADRAGTDGSEQVETFRQLAKFWSLAHRLAVSAERRREASQASD